MIVGIFVSPIISKSQKATYLILEQFFNISEDKIVSYIKNCENCINFEEPLKKKKNTRINIEK